jgi:malonate-semialdehyde dehydrogenase (acetylating)/methylmalonate-semialdehyde dehydrogenase
VARVPETTKEELAAAVESSKKAFELWREVSAQQRARVMMKFHALLNTHKDEIAKLITEEQGKTLADAHGDLYRGIEGLQRFFFFFFRLIWFFVSG